MHRLARAPRSLTPSLIDSRTVAIARAIEEELDVWLEAQARPDARRVEASCHVDLVADDERWSGHTQSLGMRGALVATHLHASLGAHVRARVHLPNGRAIDTLAVVAGHRPQVAGSARPPALQLAFAVISHTDRRRLAEIVHVMSGELWRELRA